MNPTSGVLQNAWDLYKTHWKHLLAISFGIYIALALITALLTAVLSWLGVILAALVSIIGANLLQGALVKAVEDIRDGRADMSLKETLDGARPHLGAIILTSLLVALGVALGLVLLIAPGLYLLTIWAVVIPVVVIENKSTGESFGRSKQLVSGYGWNVFGLILLMMLLMIGFGIVLGIILAFLPTWLESFISNVVSGGLTAPFWALAVTILYFRLREAKEGSAPQPGSPTGTSVPAPPTGISTPAPPAPPA